MKEDNIRLICESYLNGNIEQFKEFVKNCSKLDLLNAIEILEGLGNKRHMTINLIRRWLE